MHTSSASHPQDILSPSLTRLHQLRDAIARMPVGDIVLASIEAEFQALEQAVAASNERWLALHEVSTRLARLMDGEVLLREIVRSSVELLRGSGGGLTLREEQTGELVIRLAYADGCELPELAGRRLKPDEGLAGRVIAEGRAIVMQDYVSWPQRVPGYERLMERVVVAVPLYLAGVVAGVLAVTRKREDAGAGAANAFTEDDLQTLGLFAEMAAAALERTRAREKAAALALSNERARVARELHDGLTQDLAALLLRADLCLALSAQDARLQEQLNHISEGLQRCIREARATIFALREPEARSLNLVEAIRAQVARFEARVHISPEISVRGGTPPALPAQEQAALVSTVKEALHNIEKHAAAQHVQVEVTWEDDGVLQVAVQDDGRGFEPARLDGLASQFHFGLRDETERLAALGGQLEIISSPGRGTRVVARLPLPLKKGEQGV